MCMTDLGDYYFRAEYVPAAGAVFTGSISGERAEHVLVGARTTDISTLLSIGNDSSALIGSSVTDDITLTWTAPAGIVPVGEIKVYYQAPGSAVWTLHQTKALTGLTTSPYTFTSDSLQMTMLGDYYFRAEYVPAAGAVFTGSISGERAEHVLVGARTTDISTLLSIGNDSSALIGSSVTDDITLTWTAPAGIVPVGEIKVYYQAPGSAVWTLHQTKALTGLTTSPYTFTSDSLQMTMLGDYYFRAEYVPAAGAVFTGSISGERAEHVLVGARTTDTSTLLSIGNDSSALIGSSVTDAITLAWTAPAGIVPDGVIKVYYKAPGATDWTLHQTKTLTGLTTSPYTFTSDSLQMTMLGDYYFRAEYVPATDAVFTGSISGEKAEHVLVGSRTTDTSTLLSIGNDSSALIGSSVTDAITLAWTAPAGIVPDGVIKVYYQAPGATDWTLHQTKTLTGLTTSPYTFTSDSLQMTMLGDYYFRAEYVPATDAVFTGSISGEKAEHVLVGTRTTDTSTLLSIGNDSSALI